MGTFSINFATSTPSLGPPEASADRLLVRAVVSGRLGVDSPELIVVIAVLAMPGTLPAGADSVAQPQIFVGEPHSLSLVAPQVSGFKPWDSRGKFHTLNLTFEANDVLPAGMVCIPPAGKTGGSFFDDGQRNVPLEVRYNP